MKTTRTHKPKKSHKTTAKHHKSVDKKLFGKWTCNCVACETVRNYRKKL